MEVQLLESTDPVVQSVEVQGPAALLPKGFRLCRVVRNSELLQVHCIYIVMNHTIWSIASYYLCMRLLAVIAHMQRFLLRHAFNLINHDDCIHHMRWYKLQQL
jgi:hypothetical protein